MASPDPAAVERVHHWYGADAPPEPGDWQAEYEAALRDLGVVPVVPDVDGSDWEYIDLGALGERDPLMPDLAPGAPLPLLYRGKRHVFSGEPESIKTLYTYDQALHVHRAGGTVLLIDLEMDEYDARDWLRYLGATDAEIRGIRYIKPETAPAPERMAALVAEGFDLVVIDAAAGAYAYSGLDDNRRGEVEEFAKMWITPFRRAGIATVVLDHVVKVRGSRGSYSIGSERKVGQADVHIGFDKVQPLTRGGHGIFKLWAHKDRPAGLRVPGCKNYLGKLHVRSAPDTYALTWEYEAAVEAEEPVGADGSWRPTAVMQKVLDWVMVNPGQSKTKVRAGVGGSSRWVDAALDVLVDEDRLHAVPGARNATLYYIGGGDPDSTLTDPDGVSVNDPDSPPLSKAGVGVTVDSAGHPDSGMGVHWREP